MLLNECIEDCLDRTYPSFADDSPAGEVLALMQEKGLQCAPILHEGRVVAVVRPEDLAGSKKKEGLRLGDLSLTPVKSVAYNEHLFNLFERFRASSDSIIPVSDEDGRYAGVVEKSRVLEKIAMVFHLGQDATTLELDLPSHGLKLSEIIATIEKNDATLLSFGSYYADPEKESVVLAFRVQTHDQFRLVKNMEKYGYAIRYASPLSASEYDELREKALEFIRYMDM